MKRKANNEQERYAHSGVRLTALDSETGSATISLTGLLSMGASEMTSMWQFNYKLNPEFFMRCVPESAKKARTTFVVHRSPELAKLRNEFNFVFPSVEQFGTHHSKMMVLFYKDSTAHVVIHTANLIERDWGKKSQMAWVSSLLRKKTGEGATGPNRAFESDLMEYLNSYGKDLADLRSQLKEYDFSHEVGMIVASVPGRHKSSGSSGNSINRWGYRRLGDLLKKDVHLSEVMKKESTLIFQYSSVGSLGKDDSWLMKDFAKTLNNSSNTMNSPFSMQQPIKVALVFPTVAQVQSSLQGWSAGNSIPFSNENWERQKSYMRPLLKSWIAKDAERANAMPHVKTFSRINESTREIAWMLVTSHNLSKAAWGSLELKGTQLFIRSYEIGVLLTPSYFKVVIVKYHLFTSLIGIIPQAFKHQNAIMEAVSAKYLRETSLISPQELKEDRTVTDIVVPICMPFDLPLTPYRSDDEPWRWDVAFKGLDSQGLERTLS
ncbi:hypothetical protein CcCBS67573_g00956 [Chytriomyces confervae]|uniref:Tyrosyl-DNA phosphodiesterase n=1 Tax=Chytriomyces confervae TaxID=246404 RepID=A0A507FR71_9FUNG|nr:hypothetical protein CcCBS67573_g00956 [Chytriomyces confervae]